MTLPTSCTGPMQSSVSVDSWLHPGQVGVFASNTAMGPAIGCGRLQFKPAVTSGAHNENPRAPTGLRQP